MAVKLCATCRIVKPLGEFYRDRTHRDGLASHCKPCHNPRTVAWAQAHPERRVEIKREHDLRSRYGINPGEYARLFDAQDGHCAICPAMTAGPSGGRLYVDHDHETDRVRGLLCARCNTAVGYHELGLAPLIKAYLD